MFKANPHPDLDFDGNVYCEILEIDHAKKLVYSWKSGDGNGQMNVDSIVTWILIPKNKGTELILEHSGFDELKKHNAFPGNEQRMGRKRKSKNGQFIQHKTVT